MTTYLCCRNQRNPSNFASFEGGLRKYEQVHESLTFLFGLDFSHLFELRNSVEHEERCEESISIRCTEAIVTFYIPQLRSFEPVFAVERTALLQQDLSDLSKPHACSKTDTRWVGRHHQRHLKRLLLLLLLRRYHHHYRIFWSSSASGYLHVVKVIYYSYRGWKRKSKTMKTTCSDKILIFTVYSQTVNHGYPR